ncbi:MAG: hypothetical protein AAF078_07570 [Planctomycetota bacterium]
MRLSLSALLPCVARLLAVGLMLGPVTAVAHAQPLPGPDFERLPLYDSYDQFRVALDAAAGSADPADLDAFWNALRAAGQVPYAQDGRVAFLYRGNAGSVAFAGDHNGWNPNAGSARAARVGASDVWINERAFPDDARIDYKVVANGNWVLDPANPLQVWSGFGPNSELRMPDYEFPRETVPRPGQPNGSLSPNVLINSDRLGYGVHYRGSARRPAIPTASSTTCRWCT